VGVRRSTSSEIIIVVPRSRCTFSMREATLMGVADQAQLPVAAVADVRDDRRAVAIDAGCDER
jgi:hypothetical protein